MNDPKSRITVTLGGSAYTFQEGAWTASNSDSTGQNSFVESAQLFALNAATPVLPRHACARDYVLQTLTSLGIKEDVISVVNEVEDEAFLVL
jgi:hypothetical protein